MKGDQAVIRQLDHETAEVRCCSMLPYDLVFAIRRDVEDPIARVLRAHQTGDLEGWSRWSISAAAGRSIVAFGPVSVIKYGPFSLAKTTPRRR